MDNSPKTKLAVEEKYWLEFIDWLAESINWTRFKGSITDQFWQWIVHEKLPTVSKAKKTGSL